MARELQYQGLAELPVIIEDNSRYSAEYFQITKFPELLTAGKNLFRFKGSDKFIEESDVLIEVLDSNGQPIYYEADLDLESTEQSVIVSIYVDEETPPGAGEIILCGYVATTGSISFTEDDFQPNMRWRQPIDIDPVKQNVTEIIFGSLPNVLINTSSVVDNYTITNYQGNALLKSASIHNFTYDYRNGDSPVIYGTVNTSQLSGIDINGAGVFEVTRSKFTGKPNPDNNLTLTTQTLSASIIDYISTGSTTIFTIDFPFEAGIQGSNQIHTFINGTGTTGSLYFEQTASTASSENTYTIISASFAGLSPQVGNITKIRTFYKSVGVGEYVLASETDITDQASEFGYTPESASIIVPLPTVHRNDRFDLKFQFLNFADAVSKQILYVKDVGMPGGNVYIGGDDNLITGSVYVAGQTGTGVSIEGSNEGAFIRSVGYEGFQNVVANGAIGQPGFIMYSGSVATMLNSNQTENYRGIGLELTAHSESYLRYTTSGSGVLDIRTNKFFLGSSQQYIVGADGLIQISSSNFFLSSSGDVTMAGTITATAGRIGGFTITSHSLSGNNFYISGSASSTGFFISASNFNVKGNGDITGSNVLFTGGRIASFTLSNDAFTAGSTFFISSSVGGTPASAFFISSSRFNVRQDGTVSGSNVFFDGGRIGSFTLSNDAFTAGSTFFISSSVGGTPATAFFISSSRFNVRQDGTVSGSNVFFNGGRIGSFTLSNDAFAAGSTFFISSSVGVTPASAFFISASRFNVRQDGTVSGSNVFFDGGRIGSFTLSNDAFTAGSTFFISSSVSGIPSTAFFISSSRFNIRQDGTVSGSNVFFDGGKIGSFALSTNALSGINSSTGATTFFISSSVNTTSPDGVAYFISSSKFNVRQDGTISGSQVFFDGGKVGGFVIDSSKITGTNIIIDSAGSIQTADYASDLKGWKISAVDNGFAEFENVRVRGTLKTAVFEKETVNAVGGQLYVANSSTITGSEASSSIPQLAYLKFGGYSGSNAIQNIAGSSNTYLTIASLVTASIENLPSSTQTFKPIGGTGLLIASGSKTGASTANTDVASLSGITILPSASLTIMAWLRPDFSSYTSTTPSGSIIEKSGSSSSLTGPFFLGFKLDSVNTASFIYAVNTGAAVTPTIGAGVLRTGTWTHIALTIDVNGSNYRRIPYVNGIAGSTANVSNFGVTNTSPINIGVGRTYTERFPGYIADVRLYTGSLSAAQIQTIYSGSYITGSIDAGTPALQIDNVTGFVNGEILSAKKVDNTGFATEYFQVRDTMRLNPSSDTDFSGMLYVTRSYGNGSTGDSGSLGDSPSTAQSYEPSQVIVSTGKLGTGFIRINANPNDQATPYIDIVERTGSGIYDVALKARLGDLSGLANSNYVFGNSNPGFGLATDNVFLQGGIIANTGSIGGINMQNSKLFTGTGIFNDNNTGFYLDATSQFSLGNKLSWNGTSLNIVGDITVTNTDDFASLRDKSTYVTALIASGSGYTTFNANTNVIFTRHGFPSALTSTVTGSDSISDISSSYDLYVFDYGFLGANTKAKLILDLFDAGYSVFSTGNDTTTSNTTGSAGSEWPIIAASAKSSNGNFTSSSLATGIGGISPNDPIGFGWTSFYTASEGDSGILPTRLKTNMNGASTCVPLAISGSTQPDAVPESNTSAAYVAFYATNPRGGRWVHTNARELNRGLNPSASIKLLDLLYRRDNAQEAYHDGFTKITGNMIQTGKIQSTNWTTGGSIGSEFNLNDGTFKLGGDSAPKLSWNGSVLQVSGTLNAVDGNIGGFAITKNAITGSGFYLSGSATGDQFFISASNFNVKANGNITGSSVLFTGGTIGGFTIGASSLTATDFAVNTTAGEIELGATSFALGDGIYMSKATTNNFRVGDQNGARMQFTGDNLEIYSSGNTKLVSIGASNTIAGFTLSDSTLSNSTNFFISGSATGDQFFISASNFNVKANGNVTGSQVLFTGGRIGSFALTNDALTAGTTFFISSSVGGTPASAFFISSSRFNVRQDGTVSGSNVFFNGGRIGSFTLSNEALTAGTTFFISSSVGGTPASAFFISSSRFNVRQDGTVSGSNVFFNGGTIAGFTLSGNSLSNGSNFFISGSATGDQFFISASNFNVKANGNVTASNALFTGIATADIIMDKTLVLTATNSSSYLAVYDYNTTIGGVQGAYWLKLDGSAGGTEELRRVFINCDLLYPLGKITFPSVETDRKIDIVIENGGSNEILDIFGPVKTAGAPTVVDFPPGSVITLTAVGTSPAPTDWNCIAGSYQPFSGYTFKRGLIITGSGTTGKFEYSGSTAADFDIYGGADLRNYDGRIYGSGSRALPTFANIDDPDTGMYFPATNTIAFSAGASEQFRIDTSGIYTVTDTKLFLGSSSAHNSIEANGIGATDIIFGSSATGRNYKFALQEDRNVVLYDGSTAIWQTSTATSDGRLKNYQNTSINGIDIVKSLNVVDFTWKSGSVLYDNNTLHTGFIAQDVRTLIPDAVVDTNDTYLLHKEELVPALTKALQEAIVRIEQLEKKIDELSSK